MSQINFFRVPSSLYHQIDKNLITKIEVIPIRKNDKNFSITTEVIKQINTTENDFFIVSFDCEDSEDTWYFYSDTYQQTKFALPELLHLVESEVYHGETINKIKGFSYGL